MAQPIDPNQDSMAQRILTADSYTFSEYGKLQYPTEDVLAELDTRFRTEALNLSQASNHPVDVTALAEELEENLRMVDPSSEMARRESLSFPR